MSKERVVEILLVEDNPGDIRLTQEAFRAGRIENKLNVVKDGVEAINYLSQSHEYHDVDSPDLILLDLNLPRKDGREVLKFIKNNGSLRRIPVIVLTTSSADSDIEQAYDLHANCYITKPIDFEDFTQVVRVIEDFWLKLVKLPTYN